MTMKIKYAFMAVLGILLVLSGIQTLSIPPYAGDLYGIYRSGYFVEIERGFGVMRDAFLGIKMMSKDPSYAWIFLQDMGERQGTEVKVYNASGYQVGAPGRTDSLQEARVVRLLSGSDPSILCEAGQRTYSCLVPVRFEEKCRFCHEAARKKPVAGALSFEREFDASVYYRAERIIIFGVLSALFAVLLFLVWRWEPGRAVKELFDK
jgi:hypothetical protein